MAVSSGEKLHCRFEGPAIVPNAEHSRWASKATGQDETGDVKESNKCKHFTIRGYVADVRKRDAKICWPFMHHGCTILESAVLFPPLCVANFRWWGCHDCVNEIIANTAQMTTEGSMCIQSHDGNKNSNKFLENAAETPQLEARKVFSSLPLISEENHGEERLTTEYCSINSSKHEKEENGDPLRKIIKDDFRICKDGYDCQGKARHALQEANCASDVYNAAKEEKGVFQNAIGRSLGFTYQKQVLSTAVVRNKGTNLWPTVDSKLLNGDSPSMRTKLSLCNSEDVPSESMKAAKKSGLDAKKGQRKSMKIYMVGTDDVYADEARGTSDTRSCGALFCDRKSKDDWPQIQNDMGNVHSKKIRKVRLLEDIIRNTEQHMAENNHSLAGDENFVEHDLSWRQDTHKRKVLLLNHTSDVSPENTATRSVRFTSQIQNLLNEDDYKSEAVPHDDLRNHYVPCQRNSLKFVERHNTYKDPSNDGEGPSLMHRLKNVSKKANSDKGEATTQQHNVFIPNFSADLSVVNDQDLYMKDCDALKCTLEPSLRKIQALVPRESRLSKNFLRHEGRYKKYRYKNMNTKGIVILDKKQQCRMEASDTTGKNGMLHCMRNKRPIIGRGKHCQAMDHLSSQAKTVSEAQKIDSMKPRNMQTTESENIDDIPMDIVELLARNQHDRHHLMSENMATINHSSEMTERTTRCEYGLEHAQLNKNNPSGGEQGNLSVQKLQDSNKGFGVWTKFQNDGNTKNGEEAYHCSVNGKKKLHIDLNLKYSDPVVHRTGLCNLENGGDCHQLNLPCKNSFLSLQSHLIDDTGAYESLFTNPHGDISKHMNGTLLGVKNHTYNNSLTTTQGRNLEMFTSLADYGRARNLAEMHPHWGSYPTDNSVSNASFVGLENGCYPKFCPGDLHRTESTSAVNLLRLMDHAACYGKSHFEGHTGFMETNTCFDDQCYEEYGTRRNHPCVCPLESVCPIVWRQPRNSCLPFRPLPRIGVLGPLLQKEISNCSNYSTIPSRGSHGFLNTGVEEKAGPCHSIPNTVVWNCSASISRCKCSAKFCPDKYISDDSPFITRNGINQLFFDAVSPPESFSTTEICVVNRNPAEFNSLDEHNEYMIEFKDQKPKSAPTSGCLQRFKKKQRVMKLNDLKGYVIR